MSALSARLLQPLVRGLANCDLMHYRLWKFVVMARMHYARIDPPLEFETAIEGDIRINTSLSDHIEAQLFWQGFQEADQGVLRLIKKHLSPDGVFIDIGANIGSFTLVAAKIARRGKIHAFEPSAHHFSRLSENIALNGFDNVTLNMKGLNDRARTATLFLPRTQGRMNNSGAASLYSTDMDNDLQVTEEIELILLDDYVSSHCIDRVDLVKIDIEGAEFNALKGAINTLEKFRPIVLMELDLYSLEKAGCSPAEILDFWKGMNYLAGRIEVSGETIPIRGEKDLTPHQNLMCCPL